MIPESLGWCRRISMGCRQVFTGLAHHMKAGGPVILDIGDSSYGGVHVPTVQAAGRGSLRLRIPMARERSTQNENVPSGDRPLSNTPYLRVRAPPQYCGEAGDRTVIAIQ